MHTILTLVGTYILFAFWQSTLWLAAVLVLGRMYRRTPWKTHFLYVTGIFVATFTPLLSTVVYETNVGVLYSTMPQFGHWGEEPPRPSGTPPKEGNLPAYGGMKKFPSMEGGHFAQQNGGVVSPQMLGLLCLIGTTLFALVLLYGIAASRKLMFHASPYPDRESQDALLRHSKTLRNVSLPILFTSPNVKSPTVWCWGLHPAVLLPESLADALRNEERDAVFLHELSHIIRRDHLTALFARLCGAVQFWNPLYWFALWQSDLAADESCDLVVLDRGNISTKQYIDTLLRLVAGERSRPVVQFLSRKEKIMKRIDRISSFVPTPATGSQLWTASVFLTTLLLCVAMAFCQEGRKNIVTTTNQAGEFTLEMGQHPITGTVTLDGKPLAGGVVTVTPSDALWEEIDAKRVPKIVKMFPENGAKKVDPNISQVYLTFDIPMGNGRAWASNNANGTALDHDPDQSVFWTADQLTCVAPVKLQPNKKYVVYLNIRPFIGFASIAGVPSAGLTYSFETGSEPLDPERRKELAVNLFEKPAEVPKKRDWSPEQATGQPDAYRMKTGGDYPLAWASLTQDGQEEWLELSWEKPIEAVGVDVYETFNPGALVKVIAYDPIIRGLKKEVARWEGIDPTPRDVPNGKGVSKIRFEKPVLTTRITLILDSPKVPGWNEIDAVGLVDKSGAVHWATEAWASSTYADNKNVQVQNSGNAVPVVVKMEPANGATDVDAAAVKELRVTFDIDMSTDGYSWCGGGEMFPKIPDGAMPKWIDKRTCVLPVELESGKDYHLGINAPSAQNFQSEAGVPVVPLDYKFSTKPAERLRSYAVGKRVADYPANLIDLSTPEAAYALGNRIIAGNDADRMERLRQYTAMMNVPKEIEQWVTTMKPDVRSQMNNAEILHIFIYKDRDAMVIAEVVKGEKYNNRLFVKQGGLWLNIGGGGLYNGKSAEEVVKMNEDAFAKLANGWDKAKETPVWKSPDAVGHTFLATFEPTGNFKPKDAQELLDKLNGPLFKRQNIVTGYFRVEMLDGKMVGRICTNNPSVLREVFWESPELKLLKLEPLDEKLFEKHTGETIGR